MIADEDVAQFVAITSAPADEAQGYLEMAGGDLQQAVTLFWDMGGGAHTAPAAPPAPRIGSGRGVGVGGTGDVVDADVAAEVAAAAAAAGIDVGDHLMGGGTEADVRAPIAAFEDQIINPEHERRRMQEAIQADSAAMQRRMAFDRPTDAPGAGAGGEHMQDSDPRTGQAINQLFAPPDFNEGLPYFQVVEKAKSEGKWILVNIQQAEVFASHALNRDVWRDEMIREMVTASFLFWQRDDKSTEGQQFCQYYQCGHQLPHICVVDPRTGRRLKHWDGRKWIERLRAAEYLTMFLDEYSMARSPPALSPDASPSLSPQADPAVGPGTGDTDVRMVGLEEAAAPEGDPAAGAPPKEAACAMPEEPPDTVEHLKVSFRLPAGSRVARRFLPAAPLEQMFAVASALTNEPLSCIELATQFPKRSLRDVAGGLQATVKDAQVAGNMVLVTVRGP